MIISSINHHLIRPQQNTKMTDMLEGLNWLVVEGKLVYRILSHCQQLEDTYNDRLVLETLIKDN